MIKIAICDDNLLDAKGLYKIIADYFDFQNIKAQIEIFNNGNEFLPNVKNFQLLILDIMLSNELGTDLAKKIHSKNSDAQIMFYSSNLEFAPDAFDSYGNGFITKPLNKKKIYTSLDRVMKKVKKRSISFREIINNLEICIDINDIEYISSSGKYTIFHIKNKEFKSNRGIKEWESELEKDQFFCVKEDC